MVTKIDERMKQGKSTSSQQRFLNIRPKVHILILCAYMIIIRAPQVPAESTLEKTMATTESCTSNFLQNLVGDARDRSWKITVSARGLVHITKTNPKCLPYHGVEKFIHTRMKGKVITGEWKGHSPYLNIPIKGVFRFTLYDDDNRIAGYVNLTGMYKGRWCTKSEIIKNEVNVLNGQFNGYLEDYWTFRRIREYTSDKDGKGTGAGAKEQP